MLLPLVLSVLFIGTFALFFCVSIAFMAERDGTMLRITAWRPNPYTLVQGTGRFWLQDLRTLFLVSQCSLVISLLLPYWSEVSFSQFLAMALRLLFLLTTGFFIYCFVRRKLALHCIEMDESIRD